MIMTGAREEWAQSMINASSGAGWGESWCWWGESWCWWGEEFWVACTAPGAGDEEDGVGAADGPRLSGWLPGYIRRRYIPGHERSAA